MSFRGGDPRDLLGDRPTPPEKPKKRWWSSLCSLAAVTWESVQKAPPAERQFWTALGSGYLVVCMLSTFAGTEIVAMQTGRSVKDLWFVFPIWFLVMVVVERLIASTIKPNMTTVAVFLVVLRFGVSGLIGYQIAEPLVVAINHRAVAVQVAKDIHNDQQDQAAKIRNAANEIIREAQNKRGRLLKRRQNNENAVYFWKHATCVAGTKECVDKHAARLQMAQENLDQFNANNAETFESLNDTITNTRAQRNKDIQASNDAIAKNNDIFARQRALGELMSQSWWLIFWVWATRALFLIIDLTPLMAKIIMVRRGTVVDRVDAADEIEWGSVQDDRLAEAEILRLRRERAVEKAPAIIDELLDELAQEILDGAKNTGGAELQIAADPTELAQERQARAEEAAAHGREIEAQRAKAADMERQLEAALNMTQHIAKPGDRFKLTKELLGTGGSSSVWLALDMEKTGRRVAAKVLKEKYTWLHDWEQEKLERLRHPHIVGYVDSYELADGTPVIVLEFVPGTSLYDEMENRRARRKTFTEKEMLDVALPVLEALDYLHGEGLVHQDVKPRNILGCGRNSPRGIRLADFGITHAAGKPRALVGGTKSYMPYEQLHGGVIDKRSDLFAFGAIVFEMLAGFNPFDEDAKQQFTHEQPPQPHEIIKYTGANVSLANLIAACLAFDPNERPKTARQLIDELRKMFDLAETPIHDAASGRKQQPPDEDELQPRRRDPDETPRYEDDEDDAARGGKP